MILELSDPIKFRREAKPVMLPRPTDASLMTPGKMILVSGWGDLENGAGQGSAKLMYASVPVVAGKETRALYSVLHLIFLTEPWGREFISGI